MSHQSSFDPRNSLNPSNIFDISTFSGDTLISPLSSTRPRLNSGSSNDYGQFGEVVGTNGVNQNGLDQNSQTMNSGYLSNRPLNGHLSVSGSKRQKRSHRPRENVIHDTRFDLSDMPPPEVSDYQSTSNRDDLSELAVKLEKVKQALQSNNYDSIKSQDLEQIIKNSRRLFDSTTANVNAGPDFTSTGSLDSKKPQHPCSRCGKVKNSASDLKYASSPGRSNHEHTHMEQS